MSKKNNSIDSNKSASITPVMPQIKTVVMLMLENRSLDNLLGFLYPDGETPNAVFPAGSSAQYDGASTSNYNAYHGKKYFVTNGTLPTLTTSALQQPDYDPHEEFQNIINQLYADDYGKLPSGNVWENTPTMSGFAWDYDEFYTTNQSVMGSYSATQLPILYGLAKNYAVSDRWFSSVPTQTFANRAYAACGTSLGKLVNSEIDDTTYANTPTIFNVLGNANKTWGLYYQGGLGSEIASGVPPWDVFTQYIFPQINNAPNGQVSPFDDPTNSNSFLQNLSAGTLPNFCFLEPKWGGGPTAVLSIQGNDYHPVSNVGPCEYDLNTLYEALIASPQWENMLFVITFDEHGGTYDHVPPTTTISPDNIPGDSNFQFNRLGVRIPTLLISPFIGESVVFRSPVTGSTDVPQADFDHTSIVATLLKWAGIDPSTAGLGDRVAIAPTFEDVLSTSPRTSTPTFTVPQGYESFTTGFDPFNDPAPLDANGVPMKPIPVNVKDFRAVCELYKNNSDELYHQLRKLRYNF